MVFPSESVRVISPVIKESETVVMMLPCAEEESKFSAIPLEPTAITVPPEINVVPEQSRAPSPPLVGPST